MWQFLLEQMLDGAFLAPFAVVVTFIILIERDNTHIVEDVQHEAYKRAPAVGRASVPRHTHRARHTMAVA